MTGPSRGPSVAVVTGASRGLGSKTVQDLVAAGFTVAACARAPRAPATGESLYRSVDVGDSPSVDHFLKEVGARFGRIDVLVNNAGYANVPTPILETEDATAEQSFRVNALGPIAFVRRVLPTMLGQPEGGVIINIASRAGVTPVPRLAAYSASKSALVSFTLAAAKELTDEKILLVALCPAGMNTEMRASLYGAEDANLQMDPARVSKLVVELASQRTVGGVRVSSGSAIIVAKEGPATVLEWPTDARGHKSLRFD